MGDSTRDPVTYWSRNELSNVLALLHRAPEIREWLRTSTGMRDPQGDAVVIPSERGRKIADLLEIRAEVGHSVGILSQGQEGGVVAARLGELDDIELIGRDLSRLTIGELIDFMAESNVSMVHLDFDRTALLVPHRAAEIVVA